MFRLREAQCPTYGLQEENAFAPSAVFAASVVTAVCAAKIAANFSANLRAKLFDKGAVLFHGGDRKVFYRKPDNTLYKRRDSSSDIHRYGIADADKSPDYGGMGNLQNLRQKSWQWMASTAVAVIVLLVIVGICIAIASPKFKLLQKLTDDLNRLTRENISGIRVVRAYNAEKYQEDKFERTNEKVTKLTFSQTALWPS